MKKIAISSPYLDTLGGGERYILTIAEHLSKNHQVVIFWDGENLTSAVKERLNLDISKVNFFKNNLNSGIINKYHTLKNFDIHFVVSDGSIPIGFAKKNILHFQVPFKINPTITSSIKLKNWQKIIVNSKFTKSFIDKSYSVSSEVLYPPVDVKSFVSGDDKKNIILSVGRFFSPLHSKKQDILISAFKKMKLNEYKLILAGGTDKGSEEEIRNLKNSAKDYQIEIMPNINFNLLKKLYTQAKIYWHAAGYNEDENSNPEKVEHFGISTVEAMASGAVPIVVPYGGQKEIVDDSLNGLYFYTIDDLIKKTSRLINNKNLLEKLSENAVLKSKNYSKENFCRHLDEIIT